MLSSCLLMFAIQAFPNSVDAQTTELECSKYVHHIIDSFFVVQIGESEYVAKRDSMTMWFEVKVDTTGVIFFCEIRKVINIDVRYKKQLCQMLRSYSFLCLYELYVDEHSHVDAKINIPFYPKRYPFIGASDSE